MVIQNRSSSRFPFAHTYSIVARDPQTGEMGAAVQSHWFSTGSLVTWAAPGIGVIVTQSMVEVSYGPRGLEKMDLGINPDVIMRDLLAADEGRETRQVAMVDCQGRLAAHTGSRCIAEAGHQTGEQYSVQANMMLNNTVWPAMAKAYETTSGCLSEKLLAALEAAQNEGGDIRGMQSAAILVVSAKKSIDFWKETILDLRVEDHPAPLQELRRLCKLNRAYAAMNHGDALLAEGKVEEALKEYKESVQTIPEVSEFPFWQAVTLADMGRLEEALPIFKEVFAADSNWVLLLSRLPAAGLIKNDPGILSRIMELSPSPLK
jgi:uncharacterized Ntn-hydrolase superfamily protein